MDNFVYTDPLAYRAIVNLHNWLTTDSFVWADQIDLGGVVNAYREI